MQASLSCPKAGSLCGRFSWLFWHLPTVDSYASSLSLVVDSSCSLENTSGHIDVQPVWIRTGVSSAAVHPHCLVLVSYRDSLVAQLVNNLPAMQETQVLCLGWGDPLEKEITTHSSILAWEMPWKEEPDSLQCLTSSRYLKYHPYF